MSSSRDLQLEILTKLLRSQAGLRFTDAKPDEIENDLYNYHLQTLIKKGYVYKDEEDKYSLTEIGKSHVNTIDAKGRPKSFFKAAVLFSVLRNVNGKLEILAETRRRQPLYGDKGIMAGTIKPGERIVKTASRKLAEESGLVSDSFKFIGAIRKIRINAKSEVIDDTIFHICFSEEFSGELVEHNEYGDHYWVDLDTIIQFEQEAKGGWPEMVELYQQMRTTHFSAIPMFYKEHVSRITQGW